MPLVHTYLYLLDLHRYRNAYYLYLLDLYRYHNSYYLYLLDLHRYRNSYYLYLLDLYRYRNSYYLYLLGLHRYCDSFILLATHDCASCAVLYTHIYLLLHTRACVLYILVYIFTVTFIYIFEYRRTFQLQVVKQYFKTMK